MAKKQDPEIAKAITDKINAARKAQEDKYKAYGEASAEVEVLETALESITGKSKTKSTEPAKPSRVGKALGIVGRELNPMRGFSKDYFAAEMKNMMTFNTPVLTSVAEALFFDHDEEYIPSKAITEQTKAKKEQEAKLTYYENKLKEDKERRIEAGLEEDPNKVKKTTTNVINMPTPNVAKEQPVVINAPTPNVAKEQPVVINAPTPNVAKEQPVATNKVENNITVAPRIEIKEPKAKRPTVKGGGDFTFFDYADKNILNAIKESVDTNVRQLKVLESIKKNTSASAFLGGEGKPLPMAANSNIPNEPIGKKSVEGEGDVSRFGHVAKKFTNTFKIFTNMFGRNAKATDKGLSDATKLTSESAKKFGFNLGQIANGLGKGALMVAKWALIALAINHLVYSFKVAWEEGMRVYKETGSVGAAITEGIMKFGDVITWGILSKANVKKWADTMSEAVDKAMGGFIQGVIKAVDYVLTGKFLFDKNTKDKKEDTKRDDKSLDQAKENRKKFLEKQKEQPQAMVTPNNSVQTATALSQASTQTSPAMQTVAGATSQSPTNAVVVNNVNNANNTSIEHPIIPRNQDIGTFNSNIGIHAYGGGF